jgi:hypothetical protein
MILLARYYLKNENLLEEEEKHYKLMKRALL